MMRTKWQNCWYPDAMQETSVWFLGQEVPWRRDRLPTAVFLGFPGGSVDKIKSTCNAGNLNLIPGLGRSLVEGMAAHSSILAWRLPKDRWAWQAAVHGVTKSQTQLSDWTTTAIHLLFRKTSNYTPPRQPFFTGGFNVIAEKTAQSAKYIDAISKASFLHRKHNTFRVVVFLMYLLIPTASS